MAIAARKLRTLFDARAKARGITYARARLLAALTHRGSMTQAELAEALNVERPTMARLIDGMEQCGLVTREVSSDDRRARTIRLTPLADSQVEAVNELTTQIRKEILAGVDPDDLATATRVLAIISDNLAKAS
ncbi:MarR family winged helix-turn-helix transcriptional regulator [Acuticoccus kandeliae]|uniref:MarR family winged helix-turn-helix transcriptional regulator n=1 Tax=Acuticoccus kandeliae TaxID=2073160 RepID=UPI000D3EDA59|nr:MarR family transcriptional regulator [Acuticoccus kandeliae]